MTSPLRVSAATMPVQRDRSSAAPGAAAIGVKEWPLPTARTVSPSRAAPAMASAMPSALSGRYQRAGVAVMLPAQLRQVPASRPLTAT